VKLLATLIKEIQVQRGQAYLNASGPFIIVNLGKHPPSLTQNFSIRNLIYHAFRAI
jgi:hypothetical protein